MTAHPTPVRVPLANIRRQHQPIREELIAALVRALDSGHYCLGPTVEAFEKAWAEFVGVKHAVAVQSGTAALMAALAALEIGAGHEVITATNTFAATVEAIHFVGARPVLVDVDPNYAHLDPELVEAAITARTRAIVPVHLYGQPAAMNEIRDIARRRGLHIVEDAAQAHGASYDGVSAGKLGDVGCFSFYPGKNLGTAGEGGALATDRDDIALRARMFRSHGGVRRYEHEILGLNLRMAALEAAVLSCKLPLLDGWTRRRRELADVYRRNLAGLPIKLPREREGAKHVYHLFVVQTAERHALQQHLTAQGIETAIHYPTPTHLLPAFRHLGYRKGALPVAEKLAEEILTLPLYPELTDDEVQLVIRGVKSFFGAKE